MTMFRCPMSMRIRDEDENPYQDPLFYSVIRRSVIRVRDP